MKEIIRAGLAELGLAGRVRRKLVRSALRSEIARAEDTILYYD